MNKSFLSLILVVLLPPVAAHAAETYISQSSGNDAADGKSPAAAWKTLGKASEATYAPGDKILLKCGDTWNEELHPSGEGTAANPITIGSYGDGPRPVIDRQDATGNNIDKVCIRLKNIAGYKIKGIEFARFGRGIFVDFDKGVHGKDYVWIEDCYFHDAMYYNCTGWYTNNIPSDGGTGPNYVFDVGVWVQTRETDDVICLSNITVTKCRFERVACAINVWSGNEWDKNAENRHEFKNVVIDQCTAEDGKNWQFVVHSTVGGRISDSWVHRVGYFNERAKNGIAGSMLYRCEDFLVENSEFGHVSIGAGSMDGQSFDLEGNNTRTVFRNCLFHETEGAGFLMCWQASANANTKNMDTLFENCVFNAKEASKRERAERRSGYVFCGNEGNTATIRNSRFYLADGETVMQRKEFKLVDCVEIVKSKDLDKNVRLTAKATASSADHRHPVANATDNDANTAWRSDSGTSDGEWLELDFGAPKRVDYLILRENAFSSISRFAIQTWDSKGSRWRDCFNGGSIGPSFLATPVPVTTQKIRLYVHRTAYGSPGINEIVAYGDWAAARKVTLSDVPDKFPPENKSHIRKIVFIGGADSHGPGAHDHKAGVTLLKKLIDTAENINGVETVLYLDRLPADLKELDDAAAIVLMWEGWNQHLFNPKSDETMKTFTRLMQRGTGLMCLHAATAVDDEAEKEYLKWAGGNKKRGYSEHPMAKNIQISIAAPDHPVCRGVKDILLPKEEFYCRILFDASAGKITPILTAMLPPQEPEKQVIGWTFERAGGGRAFCCTGPHFHASFENESFCRVVLNAILWIANSEVPEKGVVFKDIGKESSE